MFRGNHQPAIFSFKYCLSQWFSRVLEYLYTHKIIEDFKVFCLLELYLLIFAIL